MLSASVCDLSSITKKWPMEYRTADLMVYQFFEQGAIERRDQLNITPIVRVTHTDDSWSSSVWVGLGVISRHRPPPPPADVRHPQPSRPHIQARENRITTCGKAR